MISRIYIDLEHDGNKEDKRTLEALELALLTVRKYAELTDGIEVKVGSVLDVASPHVEGATFRDDYTEFVFIPGHEYPHVNTRPVQWRQTKMHYSRQAFKFTHLHNHMETNCGLRIPQLAVVLPESAWAPGGSDENCCKSCNQLFHP